MFFKESTFLKGVTIYWRSGRWIINSFCCGISCCIEIHDEKISDFSDLFAFLVPQRWKSVHIVWHYFFVFQIDNRFYLQRLILRINRIKVFFVSIRKPNCLRSWVFRSNFCPRIWSPRSIHTAQNIDGNIIDFGNSDQNELISPISVLSHATTIVIPTLILVRIQKMNQLSSFVVDLIVLISLEPFDHLGTYLAMFILRGEQLIGKSTKQTISIAGDYLFCETVFLKSFIHSAFIILCYYSCEESARHQKCRKWKWLKGAIFDLNMWTDERFGMEGVILL